LHGGGFRIGSIDFHRDLAQRLSREAQARVLAIGYRLCPEHAPRRNHTEGIACGMSLKICSACTTAPKSTMWIDD
jgi:acetyl esterase/lipase